MSFPLRLLAILLVALACQAQAQMYKCVDERGKTRYTDEDGAGCKPANIRSSPAASGAVSAPRQDSAKDEAAFRRRQIEREARSNEDLQVLAQRCAAARRAHAQLSSGRRIARINEKGEPEFMEDSARDHRLAQLRAEIAACP